MQLLKVIADQLLFVPSTDILTVLIFAKFEPVGKRLDYSEPCSLSVPFHVFFSRCWSQLKLSLRFFKKAKGTYFQNYQNW